jgi:hypothetical protein
MHGLTRGLTPPVLAVTVRSMTPLSPEVPREFLRVRLTR